MDLEEGNFDLPFQHAVEETMETFDNNAPISNLPFDSLKEPEGFMEDIEQYSYAEDQNFGSSLPINNEEMIQKSEVKEEKEKIDVNDVGCQNNS
ncbi:hypothetical protein [Acinetobacter baumannii]|uniref:hypothetical protein n=1 Tax=Acinetobacter baumannii TaxID=470 RepID=UPI001D1810C1|nr:hypothetical protein [Acinetobacter baumannii]